LVVSTLADSKDRKQDKTGACASFHTPVGIVVKLKGIVIVSDKENNTIRTARMVSLAGGGMGGGDSSSGNGTSTNAMFNYSNGIAVAPAGLHVIVADTRTIGSARSPEPIINTLAGNRDAVVKVAR